MSFKAKSTALMLAILTLIYGSYFWRLGLQLQTQAPDAIAYQKSLIIMVVLLVALAAIGHLLIAALAPRDADAIDERDRAIERRGDQWGGYLLSGTVLFSMALAMTQQAHFFIAHALLGGLVISEMTKAVVMLVSYQRGY